MRTLLLGVVATTSLLGASFAVSGAGAAPLQLTSGVYHPGDAPTLQPAQFFFGGQNYCWYSGGWQGPGYYWCGYAWRRGLGWGGGSGWNGWHGGGGGYHNGGGYAGQTVHIGSGGVHTGGVHNGGGHGGGGHGGSHAGGGHGGSGHPH